MLPEITMKTTTAVIGADAPEDLQAMQEYMTLSEENKEKVKNYVQTLLKEQCTP